MAKARRAIVIGIDGMMSHFTRKFAKEGTTPHIAKLIRNGMLADALPTPPVNTPTNWTTIATGALTGTHGATGFYCHVPGESFAYGHRERGRTFLSKWCTAEYLWDAADRAGRRSAIINYLAGWPPKFKKGVMTTGWSFLPERAGAKKWYSTENELIELREARAWKNAPPSAKPPLEAAIPLDDLPVTKGAAIHLLVVASRSKYDTIYVSLLGKDAAKAAKLRERERSPWMFLDLKKTGRACVRFRVTELDMDEEIVSLARGTVYKLTGWTHPSELGEELFREVGLEAETSGEMADICRLGEIGGSSAATQADVSGKLLASWGVKENEPDFAHLDSNIVEADRLVNAIKYLKQTRKWDLCMLHYHLLDGVNHRLCGHLHPDHPLSTPERRKGAARSYELAYKVVDWFIGRMCSEVADKETLVVVVSDHAALPCWKFVHVPKALIRAGLMEYVWDEKKQKHVIDLKRTKAYPFSEPPYVWVNLKGRDPGGIVSPKDYDTVREQIIEALYSIRDPETGVRPIEVALRKEHARFLCGAGERVGDVVYFLRPPYQVWDGSVEDFYHDEVDSWRFSECEVRPAKKVSGNHDCYLPTGRLGVFTVGSVLIMAGPGVRKGFRFEAPVGLIDVAPTISHLLGIPAPAQATGAVLYEALT